jgi:hypothetical protein
VIHTPLPPLQQLPRQHSSHHSFFSIALHVSILFNFSYHPPHSFYYPMVQKAKSKRKPKPLTEKEIQDWEDQHDMNMSPERGKLVVCFLILTDDFTSPIKISYVSCLFLSFHMEITTIRSALAKLDPSDAGEPPHGTIIYLDLIIFQGCNASRKRNVGALTNVHASQVKHGLPQPQQRTTARIQHYPLHVLVSAIKLHC